MGRSEKFLIMTGNLGQQRHTEWVRKGRSFSYVWAITRETAAVTLEDISVVNLNGTFLSVHNTAST